MSLIDDPYRPPEAPLGPATRVPRSQYPLWVKLSLWGVPGRMGLWAFTWVSVGLALGFLVAGIVYPRFFWVIGPCLVSALLYWSAIRWIDRNGSWDGA